MMRRSVLLLCLAVVVSVGLVAPPVSTASTFPGANGRIVFTSTLDGTTQIYTVDPDGSDLVQVTHDPFSAQMPRWSADGSRIVFVRGGAANHGIWTMNPDGSDQVRVTDGELDVQPTFSPDGTRIAFASNRDDPGSSEIYVVDIDGSGLTRLTFATNGDTNPAFSPDGSRIAFVSSRTLVNSDLFVMNADGSNQTNLGFPATAEGTPRWAPDGSKILFTSSMPDPSTFDVFTVAPDGTGLTHVGGLAGEDERDVGYSPDGTRIVFWRGLGTTNEIYTFDSSGGDEHQVTSNVAFDGFPDWGPAAPVEADLGLTKTVSPAQVLAGQLVTYTLTLTNAGSSGAPHAVLTDPLPPGTTFVSADPGCALTSGTVTCEVGFLGAGQTAVRHLTVAAPAPAGGLPAGANHDHQLTVNKSERQVSIPAGQTASVSLDCAPEELVTDGSWRVDSVDQGTGSVEDVEVVRSNSTGPNGYAFTFVNHALGQAQVKAFVVCVRRDTSVNQGHAHQLDTSQVVGATANVPPGLRTMTLDCPDGRIAVAPGFEFITGRGTLVTSQPSGSGHGWTLVLDLAAGSKFSGQIRCLSPVTSDVAGQTHALVLGQRSLSVTVPAGAAVSETVSCPDDAKGITALHDLPPGLVPLGNDPEPKSRVFRLHNATGSDTVGTIGLICLADRTGPVADFVVVNRACADSGVVDPYPSDNCAQVGLAVISGMHGLVSIGSSVVLLNPGAAGNPRNRASTRVSVPISCAETPTCRGRVEVTVGVEGHRVVVARGPLRLGYGERRRVEVALTAAGRRTFESWAERPTVVVTARVRSVGGRLVSVSRRSTLL